MSDNLMPLLVAWQFHLIPPKGVIAAYGLCCVRTSNTVHSFAVKYAWPYGRSVELLLDKIEKISSYVALWVEPFQDHLSEFMFGGWAGILKILLFDKL